MRHDRRLSGAFLLVLLVLSPAARGADEWKVLEEHWYVMELDGVKAGTMHETVRSDGARYDTSTEVTIKIDRGPSAIEIKMVSVFIETHGGEPVEVRFVQDMSRMKVETKWVFKEDHIEVTSRQGGREKVKEEPLPEEVWLTPMAIKRHWLEQRRAGAKEIVFSMLDPQAGPSPISIRSVFESDGEYELEGRAIPVTLWKTTNSMMPGMVSRNTYAADGSLVIEEVILPFGRMVTRLSTKAEALAATRGPGPELLIKTFIKPDRPIKTPGRAKSARFRLKIRAGELPEIPSAGAQRVEPGQSKQTAVLVVDIRDNLAAEPGDLANEDYLSASAMVDSEDELIRLLAKRAVRHAEGPMARAEAMRAMVSERISDKDLDIAFASATETARTNTGDCSEHAVLLCAMLRADGIPARVATGLIYVGRFIGERNIFGWHMWTQGLIDGKWVDFDATLDRRYHAAHVLTSTSSMSDGLVSSDLASLIQLIGNLDIEVLEVGYE